MGIDERKHVRAPIQLTVNYSDRRFFFTEFISNISIGGMCITASKPLEPKSKLSITSSTKPPIKVNGIVAWCKKSKTNKFKYEIGIRFDELSDDQKSQISDIISSSFWETCHSH
nr:PilZ domain-containing protein [Deltaproteobacteria bacterium]